MKAWRTGGGQAGQIKRCGDAPTGELGRSHWRVAVVVAVAVALAGSFFIVWVLPQFRARSKPERLTAARVLQDISVFQDIFREKRFKDEDKDGRGEYGSLHDVWRMRMSGVGESEGGGCLKALHPAPAAGEGVFESVGYYFVVYLPGDTRDMRIEGQGGIASASGWLRGEAQEVIDLREEHFCAYAWPVSQYWSSRLGSLFVETRGVVYGTQAEQRPYYGVEHRPLADAAYHAQAFRSEVSAYHPGNDANIGFPVF